MSVVPGPPVNESAPAAAIAPGELTSAAARPEHVAAPIGADAAAEALRRGPIGALTLSIGAVVLLFVGWLLFYFVLFMGRGPID